MSSNRTNCKPEIVLMTRDGLTDAAMAKKLGMRVSPIKRLKAEAKKDSGGEQEMRRSGIDNTI